MLPETHPFLSKTTEPMIVSARLICTQPFGSDAMMWTTVPSASDGMVATTLPPTPGVSRTFRPFGSGSTTYASTSQAAGGAAFVGAAPPTVALVEAPRAGHRAAAAARHIVRTILFLITADEFTPVRAETPPA